MGRQTAIPVSREQAEFVANLLRHKFPWLVHDTSVSGGDAIQDIHDFLDVLDGIAAHIPAKKKPESLLSRRTRITTMVALRFFNHHRGGVHHPENAPEFEWLKGGALNKDEIQTLHDRLKKEEVNIR